MTGLVPGAVHVAAVATIVAASLLMLAAAVQAVDRKPTREGRQSSYSNCKPVGSESHREFLARNC